MELNGAAEIRLARPRENDDGRALLDLVQSGRQEAEYGGGTDFTM